MNIYYLNRESLSIQHYFNLINTVIQLNGQYYFLLHDKKLIIHYNPNTKCYKRYSVNHVYSALCYDEISNCFWALDINSHMLYKLNFDFEEVQLITIFTKKNKHVDIISLSHNVDNDCLIICTKYTLYTIDKLSFKCISQVKHNNAKMLYLTCISDAFIILEKTGAHQYLKIYNTSFDLVTSIPIPPTINAQGFMINKCYSDTHSLMVSIINVQDRITFLEHIIILNPAYSLPHSQDINQHNHLNCGTIEYVTICKVDGGVL